MIIAAGQNLAFPNDSVYANASNPFTLNCGIDSSSSIAWYFNNIPLCELSPWDDCLFLEAVATSGNGSLLFSQLSFEHAGWYTCAVSNVELGRRERDFLLIVRGSLFAHIACKVLANATKFICSLFRASRDWTGLSKSV